MVAERRRVWADASQAKAESLLIVDALADEMQRAEKSFARLQVEFENAKRTFWRERAQEMVEELQPLSAKVRETFWALIMGGQIVRWDTFFLKACFGDEPWPGTDGRDLEATLEKRFLS